MVTFFVRMTRQFMHLWNENGLIGFINKLYQRNWIWNPDGFFDVCLMLLKTHRQKYMICEQITLPQMKSCSNPGVTSLGHFFKSMF